MDKAYQITCENRSNFHTALAGEYFLSMSGSGPEAFSGVLEQQSYTQAFWKVSFCMSLWQFGCRFAPCCKLSLLTCPHTCCVSLSCLPLQRALQEVLEDNCPWGMGSVFLFSERSTVQLLTFFFFFP